MTRYAKPRSAARSVVRSAVRPVTGALGLDPDAAAYIALIEGDGVTVSDVQREAINDWYVAGKSEGWYSSLARHYLPIWANASANARCMVSGTSGTFVGNVTQGAGYVARADATGYFDTGIRADQIPGVDNSSAWLGTLLKTAVGNDQYLGAQNGTDIFLLRHTVSPALVSEIMDTSSGRFAAGTVTNAGVVSARRLSGTRANNQRLTAGRSVLGSSTDADTGMAPAFNMFALQKNNAGAPAAGAGSQFGAYWFGAGVTDQQDSDATAALKSLWETCTGLVLP